jgi:hypothetical protein
MLQLGADKQGLLRLQVDASAHEQAGIGLKLV